MVDAIFGEPRLAEIYDALDPDRCDLDAYVALTDEVGASSILDIGCGTGRFASLLAERGKDVTGVDPARASLDVARRRPHADRVRWLLGDATMLPSLQVDLVTMTGNVAQVFLSDQDWGSTLHGACAALRPGGLLTFEVRDPAREGWREWHRGQSYKRVEIADGGAVEAWVDLIDLSLPFVSFRSTFVFEADGAVITSDSTLRFRGPVEIGDSLRATGFVVEGVRDAPDRPGRELVLMATRARSSARGTAATVPDPAAPMNQSARRRLGADGIKRGSLRHSDGLLGPTRIGP